MRRLPVPNLNAPLVDMVLGRVLRPWNNFFMQFTQDAPKTVYPVPTGSPFEFTSVSGGTFIVSGGTVIAVHLIRGQDVLLYVSCIQCPANKSILSELGLC